MKSPIISINNMRGFLTIEIMIAFSVLILFTISTFTLSFSMQRLKEWSLKELDRVKTSVEKVRARNFATSTHLYGNDTRISSLDPFTLATSSYKDAWGRSTCSPRINFVEDQVSYFSTGIDLGSGNASTDIEVRNGIVYLTADASVSSRHDIFIVDAKDKNTPVLISSLHTGPGLGAMEVVGPYIYAANLSTVSQLQVISILDRAHPELLASLRLPTPTASTTTPFASSIFYADGFIYLGTEKWEGPELFIINVSNPASPSFVGSFETNTLVNDIYVRGDRAYLAASDELQMRVLDISDKANPELLEYFSPSGWQTQEGKTLDYFEEGISFGRTTGGFNVIANREVFLFPTSTTIVSPFSRDIPGGVYGILKRPPYVFLLTHDPSGGFQVWDSTLSTKIFQKQITAGSVKMACDYEDIFFATGDSRGFSVLQLQE